MEFLSTGDLNQKQLFEYDNRIDGIAPQNLVISAVRYLVNLLSAKFVQICIQSGESRFNQFRKLELTKQFTSANSHFKNSDWVDRFLLDLDRQVDAVCRIPKFESERKERAVKELHHLVWDNFSSLRLATPLLAKTISFDGETVFLRSGFEAVDAKLRDRLKKPIKPSQSSQYVSQRISFESKRDEPMSNEEAVSQSASDSRVQQEQAQAPQGGIFNMVFSYFTEGNFPNEADQKQKEIDLQGKLELDTL